MTRVPWRASRRAAAWTRAGTGTAMENPVQGDRWALHHLVLSVGLLPEPAELHQRDDLRRCLDACVAALRASPEMPGVTAA